MFPRLYDTIFWRWSSAMTIETLGRFTPKSLEIVSCVKGISVQPVKSCALKSQVANLASR